MIGENNYKLNEQCEIVLGFDESIAEIGEILIHDNLLHQTNKCFTLNFVDNDEWLILECPSVASKYLWARGLCRFKNMSQHSHDCLYVVSARKYRVNTHTHKNSQNTLWFHFLCLRGYIMRIYTVLFFFVCVFFIFWQTYLSSMQQQSVYKHHSIQNMRYYPQALEITV